jgi:hypothetical protein
MLTVTEAEHTFCMYKLSLSGSGMTALINAIFALDTNNRAKIAKGFPELVEVCNKYNFETGYWKDLVERWNESSTIQLDE